MSPTIQVTTVDQLVKAVAEHLPFPTELYADMGAENWALQIYFGPRCAGDELPAHRAGIDPDTPDSTWWIEIGHGEHITVSELGPTTPVESVAAWITTQSRRASAIGDAAVCAPA